MRGASGGTTAGLLCVREVHLVDPEETVAEAARRMRDRGVGTLVALDADRRPLGVVTDRDLVVRAMSHGPRPGDRKVAEVLSRPADTVWEDTPLEDALAHMRNTGHRRLLVVDEDGRLAGILALDDALALLATELRRIGDLVAPS